MRFGCFLRYNVRSDGTLAYHVITGKEARHPLCKFGETVLFLIPYTTDRGKSVSRWHKGVWVGINDLNNNRIVLNNAGVHLSRGVKGFRGIRNGAAFKLDQLGVYHGIEMLVLMMVIR